MPLRALSVADTKVRDLTPLAGMPSLGHLNLAGTDVSDLSPVRDLRLTEILCDRTKIVDLSPLKNMPLKSLTCDFVPERDSEILRSIKTMERINEKSAAEFWKEVDARMSSKPSVPPALAAKPWDSPDFVHWTKDVAAMPAEQRDGTCVMRRVVKLVDRLVGEQRAIGIVAAGRETAVGGDEHPQVRVGWDIHQEWRQRIDGADQAVGFAIERHEFTRWPPAPPGRGVRRTRCRQGIGQWVRAFHHAHR